MEQPDHGRGMEAHLHQTLQALANSSCLFLGGGGAWVNYMSFINSYGKRKAHPCWTWISATFLM